MGNAEASKSPSRAGADLFSSVLESLPLCHSSARNLQCWKISNLTLASCWRLSGLIRQADGGGGGDAWARRIQLLSGLREEGSGCKFRTQMLRGGDRVLSKPSRRRRLAGSTVLSHGPFIPANCPESKAEALPWEEVTAFAQGFLCSLFFLQIFSERCARSK